MGRNTLIIKSMGKLMANHNTQCTILEVAGGRKEGEGRESEGERGGRRRERGIKHVNVPILP